MHSVLGAGEDLLKMFETTCAIATGDYQSPAKGLVDKPMLNLAKLGSTAKVSFRLYTAFKQLSSMPAFFPETSCRDFVKSALAPGKSWNWCMENLPMFEKRWAGRASGNEKLLPTDLDWDWTHSRVIETLTQWGLTPNAFVDALTVAIGSKAVYDTHLRRYLDDGYDKTEAEERARQDASILFNKTQQSSEGAFMSEMQKSRTWASTLFTVYRNSPISYQRMLVDASRNLTKRLQSDFKKKSIAYATKRFLWDGLDEDQAKRAAEKEYRRILWRDVANAATFGFVMQLAWNLFGKLPGLVLAQAFSGTDEEDRKKTVGEEILHAIIGGQVEGLTGGDIISDGLTALATANQLSSITKEMPITQDLDNIISEFSYDEYAALNDLLNTLASASLGVNPATFSDAVAAIYDACQGDMSTIREVTFCLMRIAQVPQSQLDQIYFEEMGCMGDEARKLTPQQVAERYASYKVIKGAPLTHGLYDDETKQKRTESYTKRANTALKDQMTRLFPEEVNAAYDEAEAIYQEYLPKVKDLKRRWAEATTDEEYAALQQEQADLRAEDGYAIYDNFERCNRRLKQLASGYLNAQSPDEADIYLEAMQYYKPKMIEVINTEDEAESLRKFEALSQWFGEFMESMKQ
jgi:hypothetical protein